MNAKPENKKSDCVNARLGVAVGKLLDNRHGHWTLVQQVLRYRAQRKARHCPNLSPPKDNRLYLQGLPSVAEGVANLSAVRPRVRQLHL